MTEQTYSKTGVMSSVCSDIVTTVIDRIIREGFDKDRDINDLVVVARALAKLALDEGIPDDKLRAVPL